VGEDPSSSNNNFVATRLEIRKEDTVETLQRTVSTHLKDALANASLQYSELPDVLGMEKQSAFAPVFQYAVYMAEDSGEKSDISPGWKFGSPGDERSQPFDLELHVEAPEQVQDGIKLTCTLRYREDLFEVASAEKMLEHYGVLMSNAFGDDSSERQHCGKNATALRVPMMSTEEEEQVLKAWQGEAIAWEQDKCIHELFLESVKKEPDHAALLFEEKTFSYRMLYEESLALASMLVDQHGVKKGDSVALLLERTPSMVVGIYGVLCAGGCYVPIDAEYPEDRKMGIAEDCEARVLVSESLLKDHMKAFKGANLVLGP
jgi:non-ribosomal peptide synthetase component F